MTRGMILAWHVDFFKIKKLKNHKMTRGMIWVWYVYIFLNKKIIKKITKWQVVVIIHIHYLF